MPTDGAASGAWQLWPLYPVFWLIGRLPQRVLLWLGGALAILAWPFAGRRRRIAARNIALCFPELDSKQQLRLLRDNLRATVIGVLEVIRAWFAPDWRLRGGYTIDGIEHLHTVRASGRGILLLVSHFTTIELLSRLINEASESPFAMLVRQHGSAALEAMIDRRRRAHAGATLEKKDVGGLLRELKAGRGVLYAADQDFSSQNVFVPFFGVLAATLTTTSRIVSRANAVVLPVWCIRDADGHYRVRIDAPWDNWPSDDTTQDAARYMAALEAEVRKCPEQYLWVHRRFKTRPAGEPSFYDS